MALNLSAFVREQGTWTIKTATRSPYVAQRNTGESLTMSPIPGFRCAASRLHTVVVAESGHKYVPFGSDLVADLILLSVNYSGRESRFLAPPLPQNGEHA